MLMRRTGAKRGTGGRLSQRLSQRDAEEFVCVDAQNSAMCWSASRMVLFLATEKGAGKHQTRCLCAACPHRGTGIGAKCQCANAHPPHRACWLLHQNKPFECRACASAAPLCCCRHHCCCRFLFFAAHTPPFAPPFLLGAPVQPSMSAPIPSGLNI